MTTDPRTPADPATTGTLPVAGEGTVALPSAPGGEDSSPPAWVSEARDGLTVPGKYLAYEESGKQCLVPVAREWTRIGRSLSADVRFDDATVSRRHALIVHGADGTRVLDDRSLNGVYVNGRRVEWSTLRDGDQILVGRHSLWFLDTVTVAAPADATAEQPVTVE